MPERFTSCTQCLSRVPAHLEETSPGWLTGPMPAQDSELSIITTRQAGFGGVAIVDVVGRQSLAAFQRAMKCGAWDVWDTWSDHHATVEHWIAQEKIG